MQYAEIHVLRLMLLVALALCAGVFVLQIMGERSSVAQDVFAAPAPVAQTQAPQPSATYKSSESTQLSQTSPATSHEIMPPDAKITQKVLSRSGVACVQPHTIAHLTSSVPIHVSPNGRRIGTLPNTSKYLGSPGRAWVQKLSADGRWGLVSIPWSKPVTSRGWIRLDQVVTSQSTMMAVARLSDRSVTVYDRCRAVLRVRSAVGRAGSPSPTGRFWVSDRVPVPASQRSSFGSYAFGLSTVQPNLPQGWTGGDQMAIHGTGAPGSIGQAASAGCLRVSEDALRRLKPLLALGTPVIIRS